MKKYYNYLSFLKADSIVKRALAISAGLLCMSSVSFGQQVAPGIAPMIPPPGGLAIEGDLKANSPNTAPYSTAGDWLPNGAPGGSVLNADGSVIDTLTTYHSIDKFVSGDDVFNGGQKKNDNPDNMSWKKGNPSPAKCDINHFLMHVAEDPSNHHVWIALSGDRQVTNGNSFISLQFLQNKLTQLTNNAGTGGTFDSEGPNDGRTEGDFQVSAEFLNGGGNPNLYLERWEKPLGSAVYKWVAYDFFANPLYDSAAIGATNNALLANPNYLVFNGNSYTSNAFMEVALDITAIVQAVSGDQCIGRIKTLWVQTKSSQSETANLSDFVTPLQIDLDISLDLAATNPAAQCGGFIDLDSTITSDRAGLTFEFYDEDPAGDPAPTPLLSSVVSTSGTYYIKAISESRPLCNDVVSVVVSIGEQPLMPVFTIQEALMCDTLLAPQLTICNPIEGLYTLKQPNKPDKTIDYDGSGDAIFTGLFPGIDFDLFVKVGDCYSDTAHCANKVTTCPLPDPERKAKPSSHVKPQPSNIKDATKNLSAFPVPFSDKVTIKFTAEKAEKYVVNLYDMQGRLVKELKSGYSKAGELIQFEVNGKALQGNLYVVRKISNSGVNTIKLLKDK